MHTAEKSQHDMPRVVLVVGASSGIGAAVARSLAQEGAMLVLHGRSTEGPSAERLNKVVGDCRAAGAAGCASVHAALGSAAAAASVIDQTLAAAGRLDQIVFCAGYATQRGIAATRWEDAAHAMAVMPLTLLEILRLALPALFASSCGRVVAISSFVAHRYDAATPFPETAAAKAALEAVARSAAAELAATGITVNCIAPGFTRKDAHKPQGNAAAWARAEASTPNGRIGTPQDVADMVLFLLSHAAAHVTGQTLHVNGGMV